MVNFSLPCGQRLSCFCTHTNTPSDVSVTKLSEADEIHSNEVSILVSDILFYK